MKKRLLAIVLVIAMALTSLTGCGDTKPAETTKSTELETKSPETKAPETKAPETEETHETGTRESLPETEAPETTPIVETQAELNQKVLDFLNSSGVNGMLRTQFRDVTDVLLFEVLYQLHDDTVSSDIARNEYTAITGYNSENSVHSLSGAAFDEFLMKTTKHHLDEFNAYDDYEMVYSNRFDLYLASHGDSNVQPVALNVDVQLVDGLYYAYYSHQYNSAINFYRNGHRDDYLCWGSSNDMVAILGRDEDGSFYFVSNLCLTTVDGTPEYETEITLFLNQAGTMGLLRSSFTDVKKANLTEIVRYLDDSDAAVYNIGAMVARDGFTYASTPDTYVGAKAENLDAALQQMTGYTLNDFLASQKTTPYYHAKEAVYSAPVYYGEFIAIYSGGISMIDENTYEVYYSGMTWKGWAGDWAYLKDGDPAQKLYSPMMKATLVRDENGDLKIAKNEPTWSYTEMEQAKQQIQKFLNTMEANGFLQSEYYFVDDVDLTPVVTMNKEDLMYNWDVIYTKYGWNNVEGPGYQAMTGAKLGALVEKMTGRPFSAMLDYQQNVGYCKDEDVYHTREGGVVFQPVSVESVLAFNGIDTYTVQYVSDGGWGFSYTARPDSYGYANYMIVMLRDMGDGTYQFIENYNPLG